MKLKVTEFFISLRFTTEPSKHLGWNFDLKKNPKNKRRNQKKRFRSRCDFVFFYGPGPNESLPRRGSFFFCFFVVVFLFVEPFRFPFLLGFLALRKRRGLPQ